MTRTAADSDGQWDDSQAAEEEARDFATERRARLCFNCGRTNGPADDSEWSEEHCFYCFAGGQLRPKYR